MNIDHGCLSYVFSDLDIVMYGILFALILLFVILAVIVLID